MVDEGLIKSDNFWDFLEDENLWDTLALELLNETLEKTRLDKGKRKADTDLSNLWDDLPYFRAEPSPKTISNLTRSGRIYQPSNLQKGSSSRTPSPQNDTTHSSSSTIPTTSNHSTNPNNPFAPFPKMS